MFRIDMTIKQYENILDSWNYDIDMGKDYDQDEDDRNGFPLYIEASENVEQNSVEVIVYYHDYNEHPEHHGLWCEFLDDYGDVLATEDLDTSVEELLKHAIESQIRGSIF